MFSVPAYESVVKDIWQSSLAIAVWAKEIARIGRRNVESTFLCGLLFQIGRPVVLQTVLAQGDAAMDLTILERLMAKYQTRVGCELAGHWQLPIAVSQTITGIAATGPVAGVQDIVDSIRAARVFAAITLADRR